MKRERQKVGCRRNIHDEDNMLPTYRTEPSADNAVDEWLAMHGEGERAPVIPGDTSRPELYSQASWEPLFRQMRQSAPPNRVEGTANGQSWNVSSHALITKVERTAERRVGQEWGGTRRCRGSRYM